MLRHKESCRRKKDYAEKVSPAEKSQQSLKQHGASETRVEQWNFRWSKRLTAVTRRTLSGLQATTVSGQQSLRNTAPAENAGHCVIPNSQPREELQRARTTESGLLAKMLITQRPSLETAWCWHTCGPRYVMHRGEVGASALRLRVQSRIITAVYSEAVGAGVPRSCREQAYKGR